ncbi:MAG TPA: ADP-ribosylglycohydrolase family protein [Steroidobacteraceae bacterium]|jgi:ADP-ribosylglycohydrolase|nr:ADP-ribosylglycohydrolase family protein [Steroidobacteraceae bacterium]
MSDPGSTGTRTPALPPLPFPNAYWVIPGKLLAGEHPGGGTREETQKRLQKLLDVGVTCFIDLTMPDELPSYDMDLPMSVEYIRKPIKDHAVPARREHMLDIQASLDYAVRSGQTAYVHCRAGIGRTGTVIACFLIEQGLSPDDALEELNRMWQQSARAAAWPHVPETDDQTRFVLGWTAQVESLLRSRVAAKPGATRAAAAPRKAKEPQQAAPALLPEEPARDPLLDTGTLAAARNLRDRFLGALFGLAVGDALAAATQYRKPGTFTPIGDMLGGGPFDLPRGAWSDDTAMALCLAESLAEKEAFDPRDQVERYTRWQQQGYLSSTGQCVGITGSTARALAQANWRRQLYSGSHDPTQLDPEVLSRVAPVVMFFFATPLDAVANAGDAARTTCQSPTAVEACRFFAAVLYGALASKPKNAVLSPPPELIDAASLRTTVAEIARHALQLGAAGTPLAGNVVEALEAALWAFRTTDNFRDGALRVANLGANSDVAASVYGQLAGAHYGVGAIPGAWRNSLIGQDLIEGLADRLLAHAMVSLGG